MKTRLLRGTLSIDKQNERTTTHNDINEQLNSQQAMVLMEIEEVVEEDAVGLSRALNMSLGKVVQIAVDLQKKGLVSVKRVSGELYISLSKKGKRLYSTLWPQQLYGRL